MSLMSILVRVIAKGAMALALAAIVFEHASSSALAQDSALTKCLNAASADERIKACSAAIAAERDRHLDYGTQPDNVALVETVETAPSRRRC